MLSKPRAVIGRTRTTPRAEWRSPTRIASEAARLAAAERIAAHFVAARWPALADQEPVVTARVKHTIDPDLLHRLGIAPADLLAAAEPEYTFTFSHECDLGDGTTVPLIASVTVDAQQRIVKTTSSK